MSIQSEIDRIKANVAGAYAAVEELGGTVPEAANTDNLAAAVQSIPAGGGSAVINWEDINGRPDLSNVSAMKTAQIVLQADFWSDGRQQTAPVEGVLADENAQLIVPVPKQASKTLYMSYGIECTDQAEGALMFECKSIPPEDIRVNVFIFEAAEVGEEFVGELVWWSPKMTGNNTPEPYKITASSYTSNTYGGGHPWQLFDDSDATNWYTRFEGLVSPWIQIDFGSEKYIAGIQVITDDDPNGYIAFYPKAFDIQCSADGENWTTIQRADGITDTTFQYEFNFGKIVKCRYIKLDNFIPGYNPDNVNNAAVIFQEVKFLVLEAHP